MNLSSTKELLLVALYGFLILLAIFFLPITALIVIYFYLKIDPALYLAIIIILFCLHKSLNIALETKC